MAIILNQYAIKEVADVMFYELDSKGAPSAPVLYLDTLKTSTIEQSSESVDATGGKGNVKLLSWDTNKEINLTLEDAVFSAKSLAIMFGGDISEEANLEVMKTLKVEEFITPETGTTLTFKLKGETYSIDVTKVAWFKYVNAEITPCGPATSSIPTGAEFGTFDLLDATIGSSSAVAGGFEINVTAEFDSNTYYITGDTYARNVASGRDEFLQFIIPKGKVSAEDVSLTMEADGDPATFSMTVKCLKDSKGTMIKLVKYDLNTSDNSEKNKGAASVIAKYDEEVKSASGAGYATGASIISGE